MGSHVSTHGLLTASKCFRDLCHASRSPAPLPPPPLPPPRCRCLPHIHAPRQRHKQQQQQQQQQQPTTTTTTTRRWARGERGEGEDPAHAGPAPGAAAQQTHGSLKRRAMQASGAATRAEATASAWCCRHVLASRGGTSVKPGWWCWQGVTHSRPRSWSRMERLVRILHATSSHFDVCGSSFIQVLQPHASTLHSRPANSSSLSTGSVALLFAFVLLPLLRFFCLPFRVGGISCSDLRVVRFSADAA